MLCKPASLFSLIRVCMGIVCLCHAVAPRCILGSLHSLARPDTARIDANMRIPTLAQALPLYPLHTHDTNLLCAISLSFALQTWTARPVAGKIMTGLVRHERCSNF